MRSLVPLALVVLLAVVVLTRRSARMRARVDRRGLEHLRRIYRQDNPRGPGLDPVIRDQQRIRFNPRPKDR